MRNGVRSLVCFCAMVLVLAGCAPARPTADQPSGRTENPPSNTSETQKSTSPLPLPPLVHGPYPAFSFVAGQQKWGYVDQSGQFVIAPQYQQADPFGPDGLAVARQGNLSGLIDRTGAWVLEPQYAYLTQPSAEGFRVAYRNQDGTVVDPRGKAVFTSTGIAGGFSDGLVTIAQQQGQTSRYGYIDTTGKVVIEPQYMQAPAFTNGKALVKVHDGQYAVIDRTGQRLGTLNVDYAQNLGEDLVAFQDKATRKWGYMSVSGEVVIPPQFDQAAAFAGGYAAVEEWVSGQPQRWGLINRKGEYVIPAQYGSVQRVGEGLYAVGEPNEDYVPSPYQKKALMTAEGKELTDFRFYDIGRLDHDVMAVSDESAAYFIDKNGSKVADLPTVPGYGTVAWVDDLIRSQPDTKDLSYLTPGGKTVWQSDLSYALPSGIQVKSVKYRPSRFLRVYYPQFGGLPDAKVQEQVNGRVKDEFLSNARAGLGPDGKVQDELTVDFTAGQVKNLLVIQKTGYDYPFGAAHGMPSRGYMQIDIATGKEYALADLFKSGVAYTAKLTDLVNQQIAARPENYFGKAQVKSGSLFQVEPNALVLYFPPYEIAPYAAGFPSFEIPFTALQDLINVDGPFWKAFH